MAVLNTGQLRTIQNTLTEESLRSLRQPEAGAFQSGRSGLYCQLNGNNDINLLGLL